MECESISIINSKSSHRGLLKLVVDAFDNPFDDSNSLMQPRMLGIAIFDFSTGFCSICIKECSSVAQ